MKKIFYLLGIGALLVLASCGGNDNPDPTGTGGEKTFVPGGDITEYDKTSKFYVSTVDNGIDLPTYHAKGKGDIPYVNIEKFFESVGSRYSNGAAEKNGKTLTFKSTKDDKSYIKFNTAEGIIELKNMTDLSSMQTTNNNIGPDLALDATIYLKESNKTKIVKEGETHIVTLAQYGINMYEQGGQFYAPFDLLTNSILASQSSTFVYNGKNYFQDIDNYADTAFTSYIYSGEKGFLYSTKHSNGQNEFNVTFYKKTPKAGEAYRFETDNENYVAIVLYENGTGKLLDYFKDTNQETPAKIEYGFNDGNRLFKYKKEGNILIIDAYDVEAGVSEVSEGMMKKHTIYANLDKTRFGEESRSQEMTDYNYGILCLTFDHFFGVKDYMKVTSFDSFFTTKGVKEGLKSLNMATYNEALYKALTVTLDDPHTTPICLSVYSEPQTNKFIEYADKYKSARLNSYYMGASELLGKRIEAQGSDPYVVVGDTAFISFDKFNSFGFLVGLEQCNDDPKDYANPNTYNGLGIVCSSINQIRKNSNIKNVVFDITANNGGLFNLLPFISGIAVADPIIYLKDTVSGRVVEYHYTVNLDGDSLHTLQGQYNFFVMTSKNSFSCANALPSILKGTGVKIIGEKSAGGTCPVFKCNDACGFAFNMSGVYNICYKSGNDYINNEAGVEVDIAIEEKDLYDFNKVANLIKNR